MAISVSGVAGLVAHTSSSLVTRTGMLADNRYAVLRPPRILARASIVDDNGDESEEGGDEGDASAPTADMAKIEVKHESISSAVSDTVYSV